MRKEKWIDSKGTTVYETGKRCSKGKTLLSLSEITYMAVIYPLISGTVTKNGVVFFAPFKRVLSERFPNPLP